MYGEVTSWEVDLYLHMYIARFELSANYTTLYCKSGKFCRQKISSLLHWRKSKQTIFSSSVTNLWITCKMTKITSKIFKTKIFTVKKFLIHGSSHLETLVQLPTEEEQRSLITTSMVHDWYWSSPLVPVQPPSWTL